MSLGRYSKFAFAIGGVLGVIANVISDGAVSSEEIGAVVSAISAAILVFVVPNAAASEAGDAE